MFSRLQPGVSANGKCFMVDAHKSKTSMMSILPSTITLRPRQYAMSISGLPHGFMRIACDIPWDSPVVNYTQHGISHGIVSTSHGIYQGIVSISHDILRYRINIPRGIQFPIGYRSCLLYTSPSPRDLSTSRMPSSA